LHTVVREKLPATAAFWTELFEKKLPHPLDSHPALHHRLEALGQSMTAQAAEALSVQETVSAYSRWFTGRDEVFASLRQEAGEIVQKMRSLAKVADAKYDSEEGKVLLEQHFPEKIWPISQTTVSVYTVVLCLISATLWTVAVVADGRDITTVRLIFGLLGALPLPLAVLFWRRHRGAVFTLNADGINYTGWNHPLRFEDVAKVSGKNVYSNITLTFELKKSQPPFWKYSLFKFNRKKVSFSLSSLKGIKQPAAAQEIFRYFTRQIPE